MTELIFNGEIGKLEGHYEEGSSRYAALVCAPHPLYGGDMDNNIVRHLYDLFQSHGHSTMRFNYRGVGRSDGTFDDSYGETTDANMAVDWLLDNNPNCRGVIVAGFSFGAYVASQIAVRRPECSGLICVSHPYTLYNSGFIEEWVPQSLFISGDVDDFIGSYKFVDNKIQHVTINGADHFMTGKIDDMMDVVREWV